MRCGYDRPDSVLPEIPDPPPLRPHVLSALDGRIKAVSEHSPVLLVGPASGGKSHVVANYLAVNKIPTIRIDCTSATSRADLIGSVAIDGSESWFSLGELPRLCDIANIQQKAGGEAAARGVALWLEEMSALQPEDQKYLLGLLDGRASVRVSRIGKTWSLPERGVRVFATMNPVTYGGTHTINDELVTRFAHIHVGYPDRDHEEAILMQSFRCTKSNESEAAAQKMIAKLVTLGAATRAWQSSSLLQPITTRELIVVLRMFLSQGRNGLYYGLQCLHDRILAHGDKSDAMKWLTQVQTTLDMDLRAIPAKPLVDAAPAPETRAQPLTEESHRRSLNDALRYGMLGTVKAKDQEAQTTASRTDDALRREMRKSIGASVGGGVAFADSLRQRKAASAEAEESGVYNPNALTLGGMMDDRPSPIPGGAIGDGHGFFYDMGSTDENNARRRVSEEKRELVHPSTTADILLGIPEGTVSALFADIAAGRLPVRQSAENSSFNNEYLMNPFTPNAVQDDDEK